MAQYLLPLQNAIFFATYDYKLEFLPIVYNKLTYKPHYISATELVHENHKDLLYERPESIPLNINDEDDDTINPVSKDDTFTEWFPFLVLTHSSVKYHPGMLKNSIVRYSDDDIDWYATIQAFIDLAMKFRLSRTTKLNEFKNLIRGNAKECVFSLGSITLPQLYKKMIMHTSHLTVKQKNVKRLFNFVRHIGQSLVDSLETIFQFYKEALYPNTEVSLNPNNANFNLACAEYMANCLYSLTTPDIALQIIKHNAAIIANGQRINIILCAKVTEKLELAEGVPLSTRPLYNTKNPADISNTAKTVRDFGEAPIISFNYMSNSIPMPNANDLTRFMKEKDVKTPKLLTNLDDNGFTALNLTSQKSLNKPQTQVKHKNKMVCGYCNLPKHLMLYCPEFLALNPDDRVSFLNKNNRCTICFSAAHQTGFHKGKTNIYM